MRINLDSNKNIIKDFWDDSPCGTRNSIVKEKEGTRDFFEATEKARYKLEPFIYREMTFGKWKGKKALEIGCGTGIDLLQFLRAGVNIYGIDFSVKSIQLALNRINTFGFKEHRVVGADAENLPFCDSQFDFVFSWGVLHHTPDIEKAISEIYRILRPSGEIGIMLYHKPSLVALQLYLLFGILSLKPFKSLDEIAACHLESPGTKIYSKIQAKKLFQRFREINIKPIFTIYDLRYMRNKDKKDRFLPQWMGKFIPSYFGWFMIVRGKK